MLSAGQCEFPLLDVRPLRDEAPRFGLFEAMALVAPVYTNPFDADEVRLAAVFRSPSGQEHHCPGFLFARNQEAGADEWRVRFSPDEEGPWTWQLQMWAAGRYAAAPVFRFPCVPSAAHGPVRISPNAATLFERADGTFFYPFGHNVAWAEENEYEEQFARMAESGENWARVWIAPWNCELEWSPTRPGYAGLGQYNLTHARKLDRIVELAERNGIYLQLVLHEHCRVSARTNPEWSHNPYNRALGGPCEAPRDFFTDETARRLTRHRLRYIVARWGYSAHVMAWELFNEVDLSDDFDPQADLAWHEEMSEFLRATDPHRHLITTSYLSRPNTNVLALSSIDFLQAHIYDPDLPRAFWTVAEAYRRFRKPFFIGEFGRDTRDGVDAQDVAGRFLHAGLWTAFVLPIAGNAMSWWWYDHIHPHDLYPHFAALARFGDALDRRGRAWTNQTGCLPNRRGPPWRALVLLSSDEIRIWLYDPEILPWSEKPLSDTGGLESELVLESPGEGRWVAETWDTCEGRPVASWELAPSQGAVRVPLHTSRADLALRLRRTEEGSEASPPRLNLDAWDPIPDFVRHRAILPVPEMPPPSVDGDLSEWASAPAISFVPQDGRSPEDHSVSFSVARHADDLFVAVRVRDDAVVRRHRGRPLWKDDCVELWIDSRFDADYFFNMPHNPGCYQIDIAPALGPEFPIEHIIYRHPTLEHTALPEIQAASRLTESGYVVEARIPLAALRKGAPPDSQGRIGFNVSSCDADPEEDGGTSWRHLLWHGRQEYDAVQWAVAVGKPPHADAPAPTPGP